MKRLLTLSFLFFVVNGCGQHPTSVLPGATPVVSPPSTTDWTSWRGPHRNGIALPQGIVSEWDATKNIRWKTDVPGRGHASPIVVGNQVFLSTAEAGKYQALMAFNRTTGEIEWKIDLHTSGVKGKIHERNSYATSTPAYADGALYLPCYNTGKIVMSKVDTSGNILWQKPIMDFASLWGFSVSPTIYKDLVLLAIEHLDQGAILGLSRDTGEVVWKTPRPKTPNHASPVLLNLNGTDQLVINGAKRISSYHPETG
ncbi:MAG: outer membrane protein assembly factor BamB, partial [Verrucomicrobiales bacterium]